MPCSCDCGKIFLSSLFRKSSLQRFENCDFVYDQGVYNNNPLVNKTKVEELPSLSNSYFEHESEYKLQNIPQG
jgi:hypothetical protein